MRLTEGYAAARAALSRALERLRAPDVGTDEDGRWLARWLEPAQIVAMELWDDEAWHALATRQVELARETGALAQLPFALNYLAGVHRLAGELAAAELAIEEERS